MLLLNFKSLLIGTLKNLQLLIVIYDIFKDWNQYQWTAINGIIWAIIKSYYIPNGIWINRLNYKSGTSEMIVGLIWTKYDVNLKDWDLKRIKHVKKFYNQVQKGIQLWKIEVINTPNSTSWLFSVNFCFTKLLL